MFEPPSEGLIIGGSRETLAFGICQWAGMTDSCLGGSSVGIRLTSLPSTELLIAEPYGKSCLRVDPGWVMEEPALDVICSIEFWICLVCTYKLDSVDATGRGSVTTSCVKSALGVN